MEKKVNTTMNKQAQLSIINIVFFLILVVLAAVVTPIMNGVLQDVLNTSNMNLSSTARLAVQAVIPFFWLGVIITFFLYVSPIRPEQY